MPLSLLEIVLGSPGGEAVRIAPRAGVVNLVPLSAPAPAARDAALAVREALSRPRRDATLDAVPFVRVAGAVDDLELGIADDAQAQVRILEESRGGRIPLIVEASTTSITDDARLELILAKLADAIGVTDPETIGPALTQTGGSAPAGAEASPKELAFHRAQVRATQLARQVRAIDDQMTASVVPGWLFVACGVGGVGVAMTAVTLFHPELRFVVVPVMTALLIGGLVAYGWRGWREMNVRGALQLQRAELREAREAARAEAGSLAATLRRKGLDPDEVLVRLEGHAGSGAGPVVVHRDAPSHAELTELGALGRQVIVFADATSLAGEDFGDVVCAAEPL
jgi:hypothetical protein